MENEVLRNATNNRLPASPIDSFTLEACERRLVLSAQLMFDVLGDQALQIHGDSSIASSHEIPLQSHLHEAHASTGWDTVQQQFGLTGKGQTVAVIDSGIAWDHVALGQGYGPGYRVVGGWDFTEENDAVPYDDGPLGFHGTHVAGIVGSDDPNHMGVAPDVDLIALRVFNDMGEGQLSWVERALQWVHDNRHSFDNPITTVNLSLGTTWNADTIPSWATLEEELQLLYNEGIVVTASAGNSFQQYQSPGLSYPAASPYVLPVASVDDQGNLSDFSQRNGRVLAAPGQNIVSSVPDHVLGRDGQVNDFTAASGTSMAAPYVAGASVLVRQAMQMVDYANINLDSITEHLRSTADTIYDALTNSGYARLNLDEAIDALLPDDAVGDSSAQATELSLNQSSLEGWINTLGDRDVYRFTASTTGTLHLDAHSDWLESLQWSVHTAGGSGSLVTGSMQPSSIAISAGQSYELVVAANQEIGSFSFDLHFAPDNGTAGGSGNGAVQTPPSSDLELGRIDYLEQTVASGSAVRVQAEHSGVFTVAWNTIGGSGNMSVTPANGPATVDGTWSDGQLRVDVNVIAGQWLDIQLPSGGNETGELQLANVISQSGNRLVVTGTMAADELAIDLQQGLELRFGQIEYAFSAGAIAQLDVDLSGGNDSLQVIGSSGSDKVDLRPGGSTIGNTEIEIQLNSTEQIHYSSGGGPDRVYLYDSDSDDTLTARPRSAELVGVGYRFGVDDVDRIFVHATGHGQDYAYLYDSSGNDRLSMRPQFASMSGDSFFNYVRGFERVYAYANADGVDQASLYDSAGNDRFATSGASASLVGPGYSSFTRSFEQVTAYAQAGGDDLATLYGSNQQTRWQRAADFVTFEESGLNREARGFTNVETYVAGAPFALSQISPVAPQSFQDPVPAQEQQLLVSSASGGWQQASGADNFRAGDRSDAWSATEFEAESASREQLGTWDAHSVLPEWKVLEETRELSDWLQTQTAPAAALVEDTLWADPEGEFAVLDAIFSRHGE